MDVNWENTRKDIEQHRQEIIDRLAGFSLNDVLLFWSADEEVFAEQKSKWLPIISWANQTLNSRLEYTDSLEAPRSNEEALAGLKTYLDGFSDKELSAFYMASLSMRSVLLGLALVKGKISADEAFELSELEELYQTRKWGKEPEAEARRNNLRETLRGIEKYLRMPQ